MKLRLPSQPHVRARELRVEAVRYRSPGDLPARVARFTPVADARRAGTVTPAPFAPSQAASQPLQADPYIDYRRDFTREGGILLRYRDLDTSLARAIVRFAGWAILTGIAHLVLRAFGLHILLHAGILVAISTSIWMALFRQVEVERRIEIRPDCMIINGAEVFWAVHMELGFPSFRPREPDEFVLTGVYGTRWVEYLRLRRADPLDRMPEVLSARLQMAMKEMWTGAGQQPV